MKPLFVVLSVLFVFATLAVAEFDLVDHTDKMWRWDKEDDTFTWIEYQNVGAYAGDIGVPYNPRFPERIERYNGEDVILYFTNDQQDDKFEAIINFSLLEVDVHWKWIDYPHVHEDTYDVVGFQDILYLLRDGGYIDNNTDFTQPNLIAFNSRLQGYVNFARAKWGLDEFPTGTEPETWTATLGALMGGDWVRYEDNFWIARIDIAAARNTTAPNASAAYRVQSQRHYGHEYDDNDLAVQLSFETDSTQRAEEVRVNFATDTVYLKPDSDLTIAAFNGIPRYSVLSIEADEKWYIGNISHRVYHSDTDIFELRIDPQSEKGTFADEESVIVQLEQVE